MIKKAKINSSTFSISEQCRCDAKYGIFVSQDSWNAFQFKGNLQTVGDIISQLPIKKVCKGELKDNYSLINISDQEAGNGFINYDNIVAVDEINSDKNVLSDSDIIISKLGMTRGYLYLNPQINTDLIGSTEFIPYKFKEDENRYFYLYMFLMPQMKNAYRCLETGKTPSHKRVNPDEFLKIKVPHINKDIISKTNKKIIDIVNAINKMKSQIIEEREIVDKVFSEYFSIDINLRNQLHKGMTFGTQASTFTHMLSFNTSLSQISTNIGFRFSARSVNPIFTEMENLIKSYGYFNINDIIIEGIHRGKSPNYNSNGEVPVVKTAHLKNGKIIISDEEFVTNESLESKPLAHVRKGDILIASTGKPSIGKVDLMEYDIDMYADSHVTILRINEQKCLKQFLVYYLWSVLGCYQIEREFVGSTNQIEIHPEQIGKIIIPSISISQQAKIVEDISRQINKQFEIQKSINSMRKEIDNLIYTAITESSK